MWQLLALDTGQSPWTAPTARSVENCKSKLPLTNQWVFAPEKSGLLSVYSGPKWGLEWHEKSSDVKRKRKKMREKVRERGKERERERYFEKLGVWIDDCILITVYCLLKTVYWQNCQNVWVKKNTEINWPRVKIYMTFWECINFDQAHVTTKTQSEPSVVAWIVGGLLCLVGDTIVDNYLHIMTEKGEQLIQCNPMCGLFDRTASLLADPFHSHNSPLPRQ